MKLQCVSCGDFCVTFKSHALFCKGREKGKPWLVMEMTKENMNAWSSSESFQKWAKGLGITISR